METLSNDPNKFLFSVTTRNYIYLAIAVVIVTYLYRKCRRDPRLVKFAETIPGPKPWPILGNSIEILLNARWGLCELQTRYTKKYGPVYRLWYGNYLSLSLSDADYLQDIFVSNKTVAKPERVISPSKKFYGYNLFTVQPDVWRTDRKRMIPFFTKEAIESAIPQINQLINEFVDRMKKYVNKPEFDFEYNFSLLSFNVIAGTKFGFKLDHDDKLLQDFQRIIQSANDAIGLQTFFPIIDNSFLSVLLHKFYLQKLQNKFQYFGRRLVENEVVTLKKEYAKNSKISTSSFLSKAFQRHLNVGQDKTLHEEIVMMMGAGTDTTAITMTFTLLMLAMHEEVQDRLYSEIYEIFGDDDNKEPEYSDFERMPYLEMVMKETLRRWTLAPFLNRTVKEDVKIGPYTLPAGCDISINVPYIHLNPRYYNEPLKFNPDNFTPEAEAKRPKYAYIPFSSGPRICIGRVLAETEIKLTVIALLRNFRFHSSLTMENLKLELSALPRSACGYPISIKWRKPKKHI